MACTRTIARVDLKNAPEYQEWFCGSKSQETFPGSTAMGTSERVLNELRTSGRAAFRYAHLGLAAELGQLQGLSNALATMGRNTSGGQQSPLTGMSQSSTVSCTLARVETSDLAVPVLVNDQRVDLPAIHAACSSDNGEKASFYFLDDPANPLTLAFQLTSTMPGESADLQVIKIQIPVQSNPPQPSDNQIQQQLAKSGRAEVYGIYFDFGSDKIRPESAPVLKEIADALAANSSWKLSVEGHTDNVGGDAFNLDLSNRRAAAVKQAPVTTYQIAPDRLTPVGFGASRPKESNATMEGRARNRRVELVRQ